MKLDLSNTIRKKKTLFRNLSNYFNNNILTTIKPLLIDIFRSSRPEVFRKKDVLKNFAKFTGKHLCHSLFYNKVAGLSLQFY